MLGYLLEKRPQEIYRLELNENGFVFKIRNAFFEYLLNCIKKEEDKIHLIKLANDVVEGVVIFYINLPFIRYPNFSHKSTDWKSLCKCAEDMSFLFRLLNYPPTDLDLVGNHSYCLSEKTQLMTISTSHYSNDGFHSSPIEVGFSRKACELLVTSFKQDTHFKECEESAHSVYFGLSSKTKSEFERSKKTFLKYSGGFMGITAMVRGGGTPHFVVPGNCACLGANPDRFKFDRDTHSHNMDSSLQQMSMLASLVTFWNKVLIPLQDGS